MWIFADPHHRVLVLFGFFTYTVIVRSVQFGFGSVPISSIYSLLLKLKLAAVYRRTCLSAEIGVWLGWRVLTDISKTLDWPTVLSAVKALTVEIFHRVQLAFTVDINYPQVDELSVTSQWCHWDFGSRSPATNTPKFIFIQCLYFGLLYSSESLFTTDFSLIDILFYIYCFLKCVLVC